MVIVRSRLTRILLLALLVLALLYLTAAVALASITHRKAPAAALKMFPNHSAASASLAFDRLISAKAPEDVAAAKRLAQESLMRSPISASAARTLGFITDGEGDKARAAALMSYSRSLSRRDLATSIWFIESSVAKNDVPGALHNYDTALRASQNAERVLFPVLIRAIGDDRLVPHLAKTLNSNPPWARNFAKAVVEVESAPGNLVRLAELLRGSDAFGPVFRRQLAANLVLKNEFGLAAQMAGRSAQMDHRFVNAFEAPVGEGAFSWKLVSDYHTDTRIQDRKGRKILIVSTSPEQGGVAAKILLRLRPGQYRLTSRTGEPVPAGLAPYWTVACALPGIGPSEQLDISADERAALFSIPNKCPAQWLTLNVRPSSAPEGATVSIREVEIRAA